MQGMKDVTEILQQMEAGRATAEELLPQVYNELRSLAVARLAHEKPGQTLQATALVHEAYLRLVGAGADVSWQNRGHFFAAAAEAMRRILVEQARRKSGPKAGGKHKRIGLSQVQPASHEPSVDILALNESLDRLESADARAAQVVKLRFFSGLTIQQTAKALGISATTAKSDWNYAQSWLRADMMDETFLPD